MYHPAKPQMMSFSELAAIHNVTRVAPDSFGGFAATPIDLFRDPGGGMILRGAFNFVREQRASGINAVLWRDPSMIL